MLVYYINVNYAKNAMKDIQRFGNKPADFLPEPFFSYLRDGMVSKLTYKDACEIVKNSTRFSAKSYGIIDALKQVRVLRKSFVEAFNQFTFLKDGSKESKKIRMLPINVHGKSEGVIRQCDHRYE